MAKDISKQICCYFSISNAFSKEGQPLAMVGSKVPKPKGFSFEAYTLRRKRRSQDG